MTLFSGSDFSRSRYYFTARRYRLNYRRRTLIMGVLNLTPDSFSGDGLFKEQNISPEQILERAKALIKEGADLIDVGGESSRPGAKRISDKEEINRVLPALKLLCKKIKKPVSIDTYKPAVAEAALKSGASIVNTIMGIRPNKNILKYTAKYDAAIVLTHIQGTPRTMQTNVRYTDLLREIIEELSTSVEKCLEMGIKSDKIILDPGIGFGKTVGHNLAIINRLRDLQKFNKPILIGTSRKSFIGKIIKKDVTQRLMGTAATVTAAILNGANIIRLHDVKELKDTVKMADTILNYNKYD